MKKISIVGSPGSGKSTLARELAGITHLPVYHLDRLMWKPNWQMVDRETQISLQKEVVAHDEWIIDGNYGATMAIRLQESDLIIFLDFKRQICVYRAFKRYLQYRHKTRPDMIEGNKERLDWNFFKYIWHFPKHNRPAIIEHRTHLDDKTIYHLTSKREVKRFLNQLRKDFENESMDNQ
jgi:adenylate kinase family enzyme